MTEIDTDPTQTGAEATAAKPAPGALRHIEPTSFKRVLCAVDGTRSSMAGVRLAASLAGRSGRLTLLAVTAAGGEPPHEVAAISPARAEQVLVDARHIAEAAGVPCTPILDPDGPPVEVILQRSAEHDLLVLGAPISSWLGGMLIAAISASSGGVLPGGVTVAALARFSTPTLIARDSSPGSLHGGQILVASDGEDDSDHVVALAAGIGLAQGARVRIVSALEGESHGSPRHLQTQAAALARVLPESGEPCIEPGAAWDVILGAAERESADMLVMGSRRLEGLRALGSVSRRAAHDAPCSVLLVPPEGAGAEPA